MSVRSYRLPVNEWHCLGYSRGEISTWRHSVDHRFHGQIYDTVWVRRRGGVKRSAVKRRLSSTKHKQPYLRVFSPLHFHYRTWNIILEYDQCHLVYDKTFPWDKRIFSPHPKTHWISTSPDFIPLVSPWVMNSFKPILSFRCHHSNVARVCHLFLRQKRSHENIIRSTRWWALFSSLGRAEAQSQLERASRLFSLSKLYLIHGSVLLYSDKLRQTIRNISPLPSPSFSRLKRSETFLSLSLTRSKPGK